VAARSNRIPVTSLSAFSEHSVRFLSESLSMMSAPKVHVGGAACGVLGKADASSQQVAALHSVFRSYRHRAGKRQVQVGSGAVRWRLACIQVLVHLDGIDSNVRKRGQGRAPAARSGMTNPPAWASRGRSAPQAGQSTAGQHDSLKPLSTSRLI